MIADRSQEHEGSPLHVVKEKPERYRTLDLIWQLPSKVATDRMRLVLMKILELGHNTPCFANDTAIGDLMCKTRSSVGEDIAVLIALDILWAEYDDVRKKRRYLRINVARMQELIAAPELAVRIRKAHTRGAAIERLQKHKASYTTTQSVVHHDTPLAEDSVVHHDAECRTPRHNSVVHHDTTASYTTTQSVVHHDTYNNKGTIRENNNLNSNLNSNSCRIVSDAAADAAESEKKIGAVFFEADNTLKAENASAPPQPHSAAPFPPFQDDVPVLEAEDATPSKRRGKPNAAPKAKPKIDEAHFDHLWDLWGCKVSKDKAVAAYAKLCKTQPNIIPDLEHLITQWKINFARKVADGFQPYFSSWLNGCLWNDEPPPQRFANNSRHQPSEMDLRIRANGGAEALIMAMYQPKPKATPTTQS
jgi:hypothetical protein